jgi:hypothetical protein
MGTILSGYIAIAKNKVGLMAQVKLAMITKMSLEKAKQAPDSPENIKLFEEAIQKI